MKNRTQTILLLFTMLGSISILSSCRETTKNEDYSTPVIPSENDGAYDDDPLNTYKSPDPMIDNQDIPMDSTTQEN